MAWIAAGAAILGSLGSSGAEKKAQKKANEFELKKIGLEGTISRENSQFDAEQNYYYKQLDRQGKKRGLDQFRQFSTVKNFTPNYVANDPQIATPVKPTFNQGAYAG